MSTTFFAPDSWGFAPEELELRHWMAAWFDRAVTDGHIHVTYEPDAETVERLEAYFKVGLTPGEGVGVLFGMLH